MGSPGLIKYVFLVSEEERQRLLCHTLIDIFSLVATDNFQVVLMENHYIHKGNEVEQLEAVQTVGECSRQGTCTIK